MKKKKEKSIFQQEMERDIGTFKRLHGKKDCNLSWIITSGIFWLPL